MKSVALHNLGCKVNSYEMDVMQQFLRDNGYDIVNFNQKADIYIINTCTVTNIADRKSRQMLHKAKKMNPEAIVVAVGCYVQTGEAEVEKDPCIDLAVGNNRKKDLVQIVEAFLKQREAMHNQALSDQNASHNTNAKQSLTNNFSAASLKTLNHTSVIDINQESEYEEMQLSHTAEHTRAYIKIQDGCNQFCSYCVIPFARGRVRSRKPENVLAEIQKIAKAGYKEVVITGIHLSSYGLDFHGESYNQTYKLESQETALGAQALSDEQKLEQREAFDQTFKTGAGELLSILKQIHKIDGITRIRLGSLEPRIITEHFAKELANLPKVCPHFHLSLQSGCDSVLARMNRQYTTKDFANSVAILRNAFEHPAITTDVITGFPGETEEEFAQTVTFLEEIKFFEMHVFPYSKREGTVAASMKGQLTEKEKKARSAVLLEMDTKDSKDFRSYYIGKSAEVLFEQHVTINEESYQIGHTRDYVKVAVRSKEDFTNQERICQITGFVNDEILLGE